MTRDTRNNLIFLAILLPLIIPGGVMLFKAKLDPDAKRMFQPDYVRREVVYNNYDDQRPTDERLVPPMTKQWLETEAYAIFHPSVLPYLKVLSGVVSKEHRFEVIGIANARDTGTFLLAVVWDPHMNEPEFKLGDESLAVAGVFPRAVPFGVRKELQNAGFVMPPKEVHAYLLQASETADGKTLHVTYKDRHGQVSKDQIDDLPVTAAEPSSNASPSNTAKPDTSNESTQPTSPKAANNSVTPGQ